MTEKLQEDQLMSTSKHDRKKFALIIANLLSFILVMIITIPLDYPFKTPGQISNQYSVDITPSGATFSIWGAIYIWQLAWIAYTLSCLFRKSDSGNYLYVKPNFLSQWMFVAYIVNMLASFAWTWLFGFEQIGLAALTLLIMTIAAYTFLVFSYRSLNACEQEMRHHNLTKDIWLVRILIQNGVAFYTTWLSIATNLNFDIYLVHSLGVDMQTGGTIALSIIFTIIIVYFVLENFIWKQYLLYTFSPWIVLVVGLSGSLVRNFNKQNPTRNNIFSLAIISIVALLIVARIILFILYKTIWKMKLQQYSPVQADSNNGASREKIPA